ncbi:MAG: transposase [Clostridium sp.]|nr:transposase [Clostridium sp.]
MFFVQFIIDDPELLGDYSGIVQTDGLQSYGSGEYLHAGCWSHARRKFVDSIPESDKNSKAAKAVEMIDKAFALECEARKANYSSEKILEMWQKEVRPIVEEFYSFIGTLRPSKGSYLGAAVTYARNQKDKLLLFFEHSEVEMTNNLAERIVKPFVIDRKNFLFSATDKGADASALFMSVIETSK